MPEYMVKEMGKMHSRYMNVPKGKNRTRVIELGKKAGYKLVNAPTYKKAIEKISGIRLGKTTKIERDKGKIVRL